jgi:NADPH:quinone reductase-like Zn-dependent oxidoreductase
LSKGADAVIDYTARDFGEAGKDQFDAVFDTIGGREIERSAMRVLTRKGRFVTVVGPVQHIGKTKLSRFAFTRVIGYVVWRVATSLLRGPRYIFGERLPKKTIRPALASIIQHDIRMPIDREIPFEIEAVKAGVSHLLTHRAKGRIVINFQLPTAQPSAKRTEAG